MVCRLSPDWSDEVVRMAALNDNYRSMCHEYGMAVELLDRLGRRNHPSDVEKMHELRAVIRGLERHLKNELLVSANSEKAI
jgi:hypothetical protein